MDGPTQEGHVWYSRRTCCLAIRGGEDDEGCWFQTIAACVYFNETTNVRVVVHVKSISPMQENSIKKGYDENDDNNMSDETNTRDKHLTKHDNQ